MTERRLEYMPLSALLPNPANPKRHALATLDDSMVRFDFTEPVLLDERTGMLAAGHGRAEALQARQAAQEAPPAGVTVSEAGEWLVPVVRGWASRSDVDAAAYLVASNQLTIAGGWEDGSLASLLQGLGESELGLEGVGFDDDDLAALLRSLDGASPTKPDADEIPAVKADPITKSGDLWLLGPHRLLCGDATVREDYDRVLDREDLAGAVVTDPPYGVGIGAKNRALDEIDRADRVLTDLQGDLGIEVVEKLWKEAFGLLHDVMPGGMPYYVFGPQGGDLGLLLLLLRDAGLAPRHILIWVKNRPSFSIGRLDYDYQHEPIVYGWRPGGAHRWHASDPQTSVFHVDRPQASPDHPTAKPVELLRQLILNSTERDEIVLDPFAGSGSTLIAGHDLNRRARLLEIDPRYADVICRRFQAHTGIKPTREDGAPVDFVSDTGVR